MSPPNDISCLLSTSLVSRQPICFKQNVAKDRSNCFVNPPLCKMFSRIISNRSNCRPTVLGYFFPISSTSFLLTPASKQKSPRNGIASSESWNLKYSSNFRSSCFPVIAFLYHGFLYNETVLVHLRTFVHIIFRDYFFRGCSCLTITGIFLSPTTVVPSDQSLFCQSIQSTFEYNSKRGGGGMRENQKEKKKKRRPPSPLLPPHCSIMELFKGSPFHARPCRFSLQNNHRATNEITTRSQRGKDHNESRTPAVCVFSL